MKASLLKFEVRTWMGDGNVTIRLRDYYLTDEYKNADKMGKSYIESGESLTSAQKKFGLSERDITDILVWEANKYASRARYYDSEVDRILTALRWHNACLQNTTQINKDVEL